MDTLNSPGVVQVQRHPHFDVVHKRRDQPQNYEVDVQAAEGVICKKLGFIFTSDLLLNNYEEIRL